MLKQRPADDQVLIVHRNESPEVVAFATVLRRHERTDLLPATTLALIHADRSGIALVDRLTDQDHVVVNDRKRPKLLGVGRNRDDPS